MGPNPDLRLVCCRTSADLKKKKMRFFCVAFAAHNESCNEISAHERLGRRSGDPGCGGLTEEKDVSLVLSVCSVCLG